MAKVPTFEELLQDKADARVKDLSFEDGLKLLEELVGKVESGSLPLDRSVLAYERGVLLMEHLRSLLAGAEKKLQVLQKGAEG
jgi:exodeoxyribonuclease VII small subunit